MAKLILCRGLPASGKSTWATNLVKEDPTIIRLNRDIFRQMLFGKAVLDSAGEDMVTIAQHGAVDNALKQGRTVVVDDTNFFPRGVTALLKIAQKYNVPVEFKDFTDVPLEECIRRDEIRRNNGQSNLSDAVGKQVIQGMYDRYLRGRQLPLPIPALAEYELKPYTPNTDLTDAVIVDIDGTVAKMINRGPYDWKRVGEDDPVQTVLDMVLAFEQAGNLILFTSGRDGICVNETVDWLEKYYSGDRWLLYMRKPGDNRADWIIKAEIFDDHYRHDFNIKFVVDDRDQVVRMWRQLGLTVAQVAEGDF